VGHAEVDHPRPDLVTAFSESPDAGRSGFSVLADIRGHHGSTLRVEALLDDGRRASVGQIIGVRASHDRVTGPGVILLYHRVGVSVSDPWGLSVSLTHFDEHMEVVRRMTRPLRLGSLVESVRLGRGEAGAVAVTFDDGYADIVVNAAPVLERHDVPATLFLTTGAIGSSREYWWDELERLVLGADSFPARLRLDIEGQCEEWSLGVTAPAAAEDARDWRAWSRTVPSARHALYRDLWQRC
jgi:hypothetical protein